MDKQTSKYTAIEIYEAMCEDLKTHSRTVNELSANFKFCNKTVRRYLEVISLFKPLQDRWVGKANVGGSYKIYWIGNPEAYDGYS